MRDEDHLTPEDEKALDELKLSEYQEFSPLFAEDVFAINVESSLAARDHIGGTAPKRVGQALAEARKTLEGDTP